MKDKIFFPILKKAEVPDIISDLAEAAIDSEIDEGIIKNIPILKTIFGIFKVGVAVNDFLFAKKLSIFLKNLYELSEEERIKLIDKIEKDDNLSTKIGEKIFYLLDKIDDNEKPRLIAEAFKAYLKENIDFDELVRICCGITNIESINMPHLIRFYRENRKNFPYYVLHNLADSGFVDLRIEGEDEWETPTIGKNRIGRNFFEYIYKEHTQ